MNKKYIDFVPSKAVKVPQKKVAAKKSMEKKVVLKTVAPKDAIGAGVGVVREEMMLQEEVFETGAETFSLKKEPRYGVIEDFRPKFVKTEVQKRPLSKGHFAFSKNELAEAKAEKIAAKKLEKSGKFTEKSDSLEKKVEDKTKMKIPKTPFINQSKIAKRPLSKNVYEKVIAPTEEKPMGPVTIISKPEKDAKVGRVVAIILAIILGAAAGTVAFLLLPK